MFKRTIALLLLLLITIPVFAQDNTPPTVREAALNAGEAARGIRATNWNFQVLNPTTDSALGCPLVQGEVLPYEITPYRIELLYDDGIYVVHVSADGRYAQLCDSKFGELVVSPAVPIEQACTATPAANLPAYVAPSNLVDGVFAVSAGTPYRVFGATSDGGWVQVSSDALIGWVEAGSVVLSPACTDNIVVTAFIADTTSTCYASPVSVFSNVRARPSTDAEIVSQIYENSTYQASFRNTNADWLYIQPGWVSLTVLQTVGDCLALPVNDDLVGVGFVSSDMPGALDASAATILARFACPADFAGYIQPNLAMGGNNARVVDGTTPLTVRAIPSVNDTISSRLGTIANGTTLDRVIAGPACNEGYVWWLVQAGTLSGWVAEGSGLTNERYVLPMGATTNTVDEFRQNDQPVGELFFTSDGSRLFSQGSQAGFGDARQAFVEVWDMATSTSIGRISVTGGIRDLAYAVAVDVLAIGSEDGGIGFYQALAPELPTIGIVTLPNVPDAYQIALAPQADVVYVAGCTGDTCALSAYNVSDGAEVWSSALAETPTALAVNPDGSQLAVVTNRTIGFYGNDGSALGSWTDTVELPISAIAYNVDGSQLLAGACDNFAETDCVQGRIGLLNTSTFDFLGTTASIYPLPNSLRYSPDGESFITTDGTNISIRNAGTGAETSSLTVPNAVLTNLVYTPDGSRLAVATEDGRIVFVTLE